MDYGFYDITYEDTGNTIPSIIMGNGCVGVIAVGKDSRGLVGIGFAYVPENKIIGFLDNPIAIKYKDILSQMLFDNPNSIDVVINQLQEAKTLLLKET